MSQLNEKWICTMCSNPAMSYAASGVTRCICGGYLARKALVIPRLLDTKPPVAEAYRFRKEERMGGTFYCVKCRAVHYCSAMETFKDRHTNAGWQDDWCGACVKESLRLSHPEEWKEIWAEIRAGKTRPSFTKRKAKRLVIVPNSHIVNLDEKRKEAPVQGRLRFSAGELAALERYEKAKQHPKKKKEKKDAGPPPELDLVL